MQDQNSKNGEYQISVTPTETNSSMDTKITSADDRETELSLEYAQAEYLSTRNPEALSKIYRECLPLCEKMVRSQLKKTGTSYLTRKVREAAHDAATKLIARYLVDNDFRILHRFSSLLYLNVLHVLYKKQVQKHDTNLSHFELDSEAVSSIQVVPEFLTFTEEDYIPIIMDTENGERVLEDLRRTAVYKQSILKIAAYQGKRYCYDHAKELKYIHKSFHPTRKKTNKIREKEICC